MSAKSFPHQRRLSAALMKDRRRFADKLSHYHLRKGPSLSKLAGFRDALIQQVRTARPAIPEPPKIRLLAFCTLRIDFLCALCYLSAFTHYGFILMSQKNSESESVRDQQ